jgi:hypothetical protein
MKLLFFGSALVIATLLGWATLNYWTIANLVAPRPTASAPVERFVAVSASPDERAGRAVVWQTSTGPTDCEVLVQRLRREAAHDPLGTLLDSSPPPSRAGEPKDACWVFELGQVEPGTRVEVVDEYFDGMVRVRLKTGPLRGRQGVMEAGYLTAERPR